MVIRKDYQAALDLRLQGKTYGEIRNIFGIPKSTLSDWFSKLTVSNKVKKILQAKQRGGYLKLVEFNKIRTLGIKEENESIRSDYKSRIGKLNNRELSILGAALYWGEGYKNFTLRRGNYPYICFGNSDPEMIVIFISFLEKIIGVPRDRMRGQVMIYPNLNPEKSVSYWQKVTKIPKKFFRYQVALSRASQGKRPKHLLPYGTLQVRVSRRQDFFKVRGLMDGIIKTIK
ncbi:MAG: hypothetical protein A3I32_02135 [Candidatus Yanofskybacteria bacterium RIFCSPLOWO2_02_FULL_45_10]|uniref:HTH psq-type domain-containing protein n=2 Tax=Candidatus Yanofskyibacteriota TaxID=1752733 RepID=A0A1F8G5G5_9BACT|nr:MAG: hypothetical protein A3F25_01615 [Candidatus Yanofskybacteria bacterium RIFCSPHIGHO2_12_FULL_45_19b]OGN31903.1 MAG: hypothetical protein A3I32_02135 [Candidatus Yanofskybacteria bacterium RIFCSPLOWO2_02_FULL_45_10]HCM45649.1 hypothetical protein [Candidatus Veblenbacteria bacterium]